MAPKRRIVYSEASEVINPAPSNGNKAGHMPEEDEHTTSQTNGKALYSLGISSPVPVTPTASLGPADDGRTGAMLASGTTEEGKDGFCAFTLATTVPNASAARSASPCRPWSQTPPPPPQQDTEGSVDDDDESPVVLPKRRNNTSTNTVDVKPATDLSSVTIRKSTLGQLKGSSGNTLNKDETSSSPQIRVLLSEINVVRAEDSHHDKVITSFMGRSPTPLGAPTVLPPTAGSIINPTTTTTAADLPTGEESAPVFSPAINVCDNTEAYAFRSTTSDAALTIRRAMTSLTVHRGEAGSADVDHNASPTSPAQNRADIAVATRDPIDASSAPTASSSTHRGNANATTNTSTNSAGNKGYSTLSSSSATSAAYSRYPQPTVANRSSSLPDGALPVQTVFSGVATAAFSFSSPSPVPNSGGQQFSPPPPLATQTPAGRAVGTAQQHQTAEPSTTRRSRSPERGQQGQFSSGAQIVFDRPPSSSPANIGGLLSSNHNNNINNNNANNSGLIFRSPAASATIAATTTTTGGRLAFFASPSPPPTPAIIRDIEHHVKKVLQGPPEPSAVDGLVDATKGTGQGQKRKSSTHDRRSLSPSRPNTDFQDNNGGAGASSLSPRLPETTSRTPPPTRRSASPSRIDRVVYGLGGSLTRGDGAASAIAVTCPKEAGLRNALEFGMVASPLAVHSVTLPAPSSSPDRVRTSTAVAVPSASSPLHVGNEASPLSANDAADPSTQSAPFLEPSPPPLVSSASILGGVIAAVARGPTIIASREEDDDEEEYFEDDSETAAATSGGIAGDGDDGTATTRRKKKASVLASPSPAPAPVRPPLRATLSGSDGGNKTTGLIRGSTTTAGAAVAVSKRANTTATSLGGSRDYTSTNADESANYLGNVLDADSSGGKSPDVSERFLLRQADRRGGGSRTQGTSVPTATQDRPMLADLEDTVAALRGDDGVGKGAVGEDGEDNGDNTNEGEESGAILLHEVSKEPLGKKALKRAQRMQNKELAKAKYKAAAANTIPAVVRGGGDRANQKPLTGGKGTIGSGIVSFFNNVLVNKERAAIEKRFMDEIMSEESSGRFYEREKEQSGTHINYNKMNNGRCGSEEDTHRVGFRDRVALYFISSPFLLWLVSSRKGLILMLGLQTLLIMCLHGIATEMIAALY